MPTIEQATVFHSGRDKSGKSLSAKEREKVLAPYLPKELPNQQKDNSAGIRFHHRQRVRPAIKHIVHWLLHTFIHVFFSIYLRVRQSFRIVKDRMFAMLCYHHHTPELIQKDVRNLSKVPKHLSVILQLPQTGGKKEKLESVTNEACEIVAWTACAGIPLISIYEKTGLLKTSLPDLHRHISQTMDSWFGAESPNRPTISLRAPHIQSYSPPQSPEPANYEDSRPHLTILLIDASDGRQTLVDLTKTLAEMSQIGKLHPSDISSELIDAEISESVMGEPDLLILFGNRVVLDGYPPWQVRLTEIFHVQDNIGGVGYHVFLRALYKFAKAQMRFGA